MPVERVSHDGGKLYVEVSGEGPSAIVMPVAWGMSHDFHQALLEPLDLPIRLVFFDPEGTGVSTLMPRGWNPARIVDEAESVRESLDLPKAIVLGHASGAFMSIAYALEYPGRIGAMVLVSPYASYTRANELAAGRLEAREGWSSFQTRVSEMRRVDLTPEQRFRATYKEQRTLDLHDYGSHYFEMADAADQASFNPAMADDEETDFLDELHTIEAPVLIVSGLDDPLSPIEESRLMAAAFPFVRLVEFPECGHFPFVEKPDEFVDVVNGFLTDTSNR